jgi:hypothetical protein
VSHFRIAQGRITAGWPLRRRLCHGDARHARVLRPAAHLAAARVKMTIGSGRMYADSVVIHS